MERFERKFKKWSDTCATGARKELLVVLHELANKHPTDESVNVWAGMATEQLRTHLTKTLTQLPKPNAQVFFMLDS